MSAPAARPELLSLAGRVAVVTGAGAIAAATARKFSHAGAWVGLVNRAGGAADTRGAIEASGDVASTFTADPADPEAISRVFERIGRERGGLDVLVNGGADCSAAPLDHLDEDDVERALGVELRSAIVCTRAALPYLRASGRGRILSTSSVWARLGARGCTTAAAFGGAIIGLTRAWARELGPARITANCVAPGLIASAVPDGVGPAEVEATLARIPAGRLGTADEVAGVFLFLASDLASFMSGAVVGVDGGMLLY